MEEMFQSMEFSWEDFHSGDCEGAKGKETFTDSEALSQLSVELFPFFINFQMLNVPKIFIKVLIVQN